MDDSSEEDLLELTKDISFMFAALAEAICRQPDVDPQMFVRDLKVSLRHFSGVNVARPLLYQIEQIVLIGAARAASSRRDADGTPPPSRPLSS